MKLPAFVLTGLFLIGVGGMMSAGHWTAMAQEQAGLKKVPITRSNPASGKQMYSDYCAACHGAQGRGDGPAVEYLKTPPPDLTQMAQHNGGKFPALKVNGILRFGVGNHAHGTTDMPVWGPLFRSVDLRDETQTNLRITNLTDYLQQMQKK